MKVIPKVQNRIFIVRGARVMLDIDLATLFKTETQVLRLAIKLKRNRFPADFMFQLSPEDFEELKFQIESSKMNPDSLRSQIVISKAFNGKAILPFAFTEQGILMLSFVLKSDVAINLSIAVIRAFGEASRALIQDGDINEQLYFIKRHLNLRDAQISPILHALESMIAR